MKPKGLSPGTDTLIMENSLLTKNRIDELFKSKKEQVLAVYFTAGYPEHDDTMPVMEYLQDAGADIIEIGMPYSDPLADGPTIQESSSRALNNGMNLKVLFSQIADMRSRIEVPVILMGYLNPVMQYGIEAFCKRCREVGVDALILPDLPIREYLNQYKDLFEKYGLYNIFLISPQTPESRIRTIDEHSHGFIYMVSSASVTGAKHGITAEQEAYFNRINAMGLKHPRLIGFGISDRDSFMKASAYANGAIIGSAFIRLLKESKQLKKDITHFIHSVKDQNNLS